MKLITKEIEKNIGRLYTTDGIEAEHIRVYAKWFHPATEWTWYLIEYDPETGTCFGFVHGDEGELGYFNREEIENVHKGQAGLKRLPVERDIRWNDKVMLSEVMKASKEGRPL
jgi:hypothetical protein